MSRQSVSRRTFTKGLAVGGVVAGLGVWRPSLWAQAPPAAASAVVPGQALDLRVAETTVDFTGRPRQAITINGSLPAPVLRWKEGDTVAVRVVNGLREETSIHWHGIVLPANMDGVPGLSFNGIPAGGSYLYRFPVRQAGTYWYHSHSGFQEQRGLYGALIITPQEPEPFAYDREHVVLLSDWSDERPERVFAKLKKQSNYYNYRQRTVGDFFGDVRRQGLSRTLAERRMWGDMRMSPTDLADVSGSTYTYLMNGTAPAGNWTGLFTPGERVRLRVINASAMSYFDVRIPGVKMTVVAADGQYVQPVTVDEFRVATAETFDVIVEPSGQDAFTIFAQSNDRTGYAAGTLAVRPGLRAAVPVLDPRPIVTMSDMGHGTASSNLPAGAPATDPHAGHSAAGVGGGVGGGVAVDGPAPTAAGHTPVERAEPARSTADPHANHAAAPRPADPHAAHAAGAPAQSSGAAAGEQAPPQSDAHAGHDMSAMDAHSIQSHPASEQGNPLVDMQTMTPSSRLDDPGIGLRHNGRRVLTYADLKSTFADPDGREPSRTIELHLTGHMERFAWSFNGVKFAEAAPLRLTYGERVRIVLVNDTMMTHPIHLHGMWSDLEDDAGRFLVRKHTIDMPPGTKRSYRVTADALGRWAYHCHLMFHMEAGMFREVRVEG
jgi:CopA family copper-resistance protein